MRPSTNELASRILRRIYQLQRRLQTTMSGDWEQGLCSCFNDCTTCIIVYFCPCYIVGKNAEAVGDSCLICGLAEFFWPISLYTRTHIRGKIRENKGIAGSCIGDLCLVYWCYLCTICQEAQEVKSISGQAMVRE